MNSGVKGERKRGNEWVTSDKNFQFKNSLYSIFPRVFESGFMCSIPHKHIILITYEKHKE